MSQIAAAIAAGFRLVKTVMDTAESRRLRKALDSAEKYIQVNERNGQFANFTDEQREKNLLRYRKRFFKYN